MNHLQHATCFILRPQRWCWNPTSLLLGKSLWFCLLFKIISTSSSQNEKHNFTLNFRQRQWLVSGWQSKKQMGYHTWSELGFVVFLRCFLELFLLGDCSAIHKEELLLLPQLSSSRSEKPSECYSPMPLVWLKSPFTTLQVFPSPLQIPQRSSLAAEPMIPSQPIF